MRENSLSFMLIAEKCLAIFGASSRSSARMASLVWAPARSQNIDEAWSSACPDSSSAASVFSIVGASASLAIASISSAWAASAASITGAKSASSIFVKSGRPSGPVQAVSGWVARSTVAEEELMSNLVREAGGTCRGRVVW